MKIRFADEQNIMGFVDFNKSEEVARTRVDVKLLQNLLDVVKKLRSSTEIVIVKPKDRNPDREQIIVFCNDELNTGLALAPRLKEI